ncbi:MAG: uroporphyrinogen decarboxylase family protein [Candidatus Hodarchaeales archaeon]|jgi:uroporphyrinogen decarboxylase
MNSKERVITAFQHQEPDKVPLLEVWIESTILRALDGDHYSVRERLGIDCLPLGDHPKNTKAYGHGIDEWGRVFKDGHYVDGLVKNLEDLEKFTPPLSHAEDWFPSDEIKNIKKTRGEDYALYFAWHDISLGLTYLSMGFETFFRSIYEQSELVEQVIERSTDWAIALIEQANAAGVDFIVLGDDVADNSRPMISPGMFSDLILPEYKKIVAASDVPLIWHSDGNISSLLPFIIESGFKGVHSLEPKANVDLSQIKEKYGDKLVLAGNLDTTEILTQSNLDFVRSDVKRCITQGAPGGGYLFSSSNSLFDGHVVKAILEAYRYAREIGNYPIKT